MIQSCPNAAFWDFWDHYNPFLGYYIGLADERQKTKHSKLGNRGSLHQGGPIGTRNQYTETKSMGTAKDDTRKGCKTKHDGTRCKRTRWNHSFPVADGGEYVNFVQIPKRIILILIHIINVDDFFGLC
jgi:hypothetical protein